MDLPVEVNGEIPAPKVALSYAGEKPKDVAELYHDRVAFDLYGLARIAQVEKEDFNPWQQALVVQAYQTLAEVVNGFKQSQKVER